MQSVTRRCSSIDQGLRWSGPSGPVRLALREQNSPCACAGWRSLSSDRSRCPRSKYVLNMYSVNLIVCLRSECDGRVARRVWGATGKWPLLRKPRTRRPIPIHLLVGTPRRQPGAERPALTSPHRDRKCRRLLRSRPSPDPARQPSRRIGSSPDGQALTPASHRVPVD